MKILNARTLLLVSSLSYFLSNTLEGLSPEWLVVSGGLKVLGLIALLLGIIAIFKERKDEKAPEVESVQESETV